jgi:hypothetical protein
MSSRPELRLDWCTHEAAKYAVEKWHYSRCIPKSKLAKIGVWESGRFIGVVIYGVGATADLVKRYGLKMTEGCELVRVALTSHENPVSKIVAVSLKLLRREYQGLRLVVSFADPEQGHKGGIYQAGNWIFAGQSQASDEYIFKGKRWQGRSFRNKYKGMEKHPSVTIVKGSSKYRYLMPLDDEMRKQIEPLRKPYPKRVRSEVSGTIGSQPIGGGATPTRTLIDSLQARRSAGNADTSTT